MTNTDKLLLLAMEACRPDQVETLLAISRKKGRPLAELIVEIIRTMRETCRGKNGRR